MKGVDDLLLSEYYGPLSRGEIAEIAEGFVLAGCEPVDSAVECWNCGKRFTRKQLKAIAHQMEMLSDYTLEYNDGRKGYTTVFDSYKDAVKAAWKIWTNLSDKGREDLADFEDTGAYLVIRVGTTDGQMGATIVDFDEDVIQNIRAGIHVDLNTILYMRDAN